MLRYQGNPVRDQFETVGDKVYLRVANICPCARSVAEAVTDFLGVWRRGGDACWALAESAFEEGRSLFAKLIGASPGRKSVAIARADIVPIDAKTLHLISRQLHVALSM